MSESLNHSTRLGWSSR